MPFQIDLLTLNHNKHGVLNHQGVSESKLLALLQHEVRHNTSINDFLVQMKRTRVIHTKNETTAKPF